MRLDISEKKIFSKMINNLFNYKIKNHINGISIDSRKIKENDVYIALKGKKYDGHDFIPEAINKGASIIFSEKKYTSSSTKIINVESNIQNLGIMANYWRKKIKGIIIGITGSNGKTTTKNLIYHVLSKNKSCENTIGNYNSTIGLPLSLALQ